MQSLSTRPLRCGEPRGRGVGRGTTARAWRVGTKWRLGLAQSGRRLAATGPKPPPALREVATRTVTDTAAITSQRGGRQWIWPRSTTATGRRRAGTSIVRDHSARVYRLAYRLTGNRHDAEDLTQEVFVRVFRSLSTFRPGTFEGWMHRITTNLFLDQARRRRRIRFDALPLRLRRQDARADTVARPRAGPRPVRRRHRGGAREASARVPRRRRPLRRRGPDLRGDRPAFSASRSAPCARASTEAARCSARR